MGALYDFFNFIYPDQVQQPAMEAAEDITGNVEKEAKNITGDDNGVEMSDNSDGSIDTNTDDILGTKGGDNDSTSDNSSELKEDTNNTDDITDENSEFDDEEGGDDDDNLDDYSSDDENSDPQELKMKLLLHKNYNYLFEILDSNISIISDYAPNTLDENVIQTMAMAKERLEECKQLISSTLKNDFKSASYATLIKRYVGINRVYDLVIEMVRRVSEDAAKSIEKNSNNKK